MKIPFGKPLIDHKEINLVTKVLKSGIYVHGPKSKEFDAKFNSTDTVYSLEKQEY